MRCEVLCFMGHLHLVFQGKVLNLYLIHLHISEFISQFTLNIVKYQSGAFKIDVNITGLGCDGLLAS